MLISAVQQSDTVIHTFFFIFFFSINLFLAASGLRCCARSFSSCGEQGLLIAVASLVAEHRF